MNSFCNGCNEFISNRTWSARPFLQPTQEHPPLKLWPVLLPLLKKCNRSWLLCALSIPVLMIRSWTPCQSSNFPQSSMILSLPSILAILWSVFIISRSVWTVCSIRSSSVSISNIELKNIEWRIASVSACSFSPFDIRYSLIGVHYFLGPLWTVCSIRSSSVSISNIEQRISNDELPFRVGLFFLSLRYSLFLDRCSLFLMSLSIVFSLS